MRFVRLSFGVALVKRFRFNENSRILVRIIPIRLFDRVWRYPLSLDAPRRGRGLEGGERVSIHQ